MFTLREKKLGKCDNLNEYEHIALTFLLLALSHPHTHKPSLSLSHTVHSQESKFYFTLYHVHRLILN